MTIYIDLHRLVSEAYNASEKSGGFNPTFVLVDFVDMGNTMQVVNFLNGLGNTSAPNITANGTAIQELSRSSGKQIFGPDKLYSLLLGSMLSSVLAIFMLV